MPARRGASESAARVHRTGGHERCDWDRAGLLRLDPGLAITSLNRKESLGRGWGDLHETVEQLAIVDPFVGRAEQSTSAADAPRRADRLCAVGQARPCVLQVPLDVLAKTIDDDPVAAPPSRPVQPEHQAIDAAAQSLTGATAPCLVLGGGSTAADSELTRLAQRLGAPVLTGSNLGGANAAPRHGSGCRTAMSSSLSEPSWTRPILDGAVADRWEARPCRRRARALLGSPRRRSRSTPTRSSSPARCWLRASGTARPRGGCRRRRPAPARGGCWRSGTPDPLRARLCGERRRTSLSQP